MDFDAAEINVGYAESADVEVGKGLFETRADELFKIKRGVVDTPIKLLVDSDVVVEDTNLIIVTSVLAVEFKRLEDRNVVKGVETLIEVDGIDVEKLLLIVEDGAITVDLELSIVVEETEEESDSDWDDTGTEIVATFL